MNFIDRAKLLGHDTTNLKDGETISSTVVVNSIEDFRTLFGSDAGDAARADFSAAMNKQLEPVAIRMIPQAALTRLIDYVYGNGHLSHNDKLLADSIFPIKITAVSAQETTIKDDLTYGPSASPYLLNAGTLTFDGGSISLLNTPGTVTADTLVVKEGGKKPYHVGIFGGAGIDGDPGQKGPSYPNPAAPGADKNPASPGVCTGVGPGGTGKNGVSGGDGLPGRKGGDGLPSLPANIRINAFDSSNSTSYLAVYTESGAGGQGGTGGAGGAGQAGGRGGNGCDSDCEGTDGGPGGNGGAGGKGGDGGPGGNGASGQPITISFPEVSKDSLTTSSKDLPGGQGGNGGAGGEGGARGNGGNGGKKSAQGEAGNDGKPGEAGNDGEKNGNFVSHGEFKISYHK